MARRVGTFPKSTKPTQEIYRPPPARAHGQLLQSCSTAPSPTPKDVRQAQLSGPKGTAAVQKRTGFRVDRCEAAPVPALPSSTNGQGATAESDPICPEAIARRERAPAIYRDMLVTAMRDPSAVCGIFWEELARVLCDSVIEGDDKPLTVAQPCAFIVAKDKSGNFSHALINTVHKWFDRRWELLEAPRGYPRRWIAFVYLVAELFLRLRRQSGDTHDISMLAILLCKCCLVMLRPPMLGNDWEMKCLRQVLTAAGSAVQSTVPWFMRVLTRRMRNAFVQSNVSDQARHTLLELIELRASGWQLSTAQARYYHDPLVEPGFL